MKTELHRFQELTAAIHYRGSTEVDLDITSVNMYNEESDNETNRKIQMISEQSCHHHLDQSVNVSLSLLNEQINPTFL